MYVIPVFIIISYSCLQILDLIKFIKLRLIYYKILKVGKAKIVLKMRELVDIAILAKEKME